MPWGDNGVTIRRQLLDQTAPAFAWSGATARVPFRGLRTAGYLRGLHLWLPTTSFTGTYTAGTNTAQNLNAYQAIQRFQLTLQGIAQLYDVTGLDLVAAAYMRNGNGTLGGSGLTSYSTYNAGATPVAAPNGGNAVVGSTANANGFATGIVANGTTNVSYTAFVDLPITEYIVIKDAVLSQGPNHVVVADKLVEMGMLTLQNTSSNVQPYLNLNPFYSTTANANAVYIAATGSLSGNVAWNLSADIYDVPPVATDRPSPMQQAFVITRQSFDTTSANGAATVQFQAAGSIMRIAHICLDVNGNPVDIIAAGNGGSALARFRWGATTDKFAEYYNENAIRMFIRNNQVPPAGYWFFDLTSDDLTATDFINTAEVTNLRTEFTGLPASVVTIRTYTERLVPVTTV